jgi:hypothetical protein
MRRHIREVWGFYDIKLQDMVCFWVKMLLKLCILLVASTNTTFTTVTYFNKLSKSVLVRFSTL